jgi:hypothetical protein
VDECSTTGTARQAGGLIGPSITMPSAGLDELSFANRSGALHSQEISSSFEES